MRLQESSILVEDIIRDTVAVMEKQGYCKGHMKKHRSIYRAIALFSKEKFDGKYSFEVGETYVRSITQRKPPLSAEHFRTHINAVERLNHVLEGEQNWYPPLKMMVAYADSSFRKELADYGEYLRNSGKTESDLRSRMHLVARFLQFAAEHDVESFQYLTPQCIYAAFQAATDKGGFRKAVCSFFQYAFRHGLTQEDFSIIVPSVARHTPVPSVYSPEEVESILAATAKSRMVRKRNFAIILIVARLGLRSCDVANLKFENIHFERETIELTQIKTKEPLILPLLPEIRDALADYVENERPHCDSDRIFLNSIHPKEAPLHPHTIYTIVEQSIQISSVEAKGRRRGPHALRASLATALLNEGNDYPVIQEVLGHRTPDAAKAYVKVDVEHLRAYALPVPQPSAGFARRLGMVLGT